MPELAHIWHLQIPPPLSDGQFQDELTVGPIEISHQQAATDIAYFPSTVADLGEDALRIHTPCPTFFFFRENLSLQGQEK